MRFDLKKKLLCFELMTFCVLGDVIRTKLRELTHSWSPPLLYRPTQAHATLYWKRHSGKNFAKPQLVACVIDKFRVQLLAAVLFRAVNPSGVVAPETTCSICKMQTKWNKTNNNKNLLLLLVNQSPHACLHIPSCTMKKGVAGYFCKKSLMDILQELDTRQKEM